MPEFIDPFKGVIPDRKLSPRELTRAIRLAISAEEEAIHLYEALADSVDNPLAKEVLQDIANEEKVHAGEFQRLLSIMLPDEEGFLAKGAGEVNTVTVKINVSSSSTVEGVRAIPTIGSMKEK